MGTTVYPTVPVAQPDAEPWPIDEHTIRVDEMFTRQLDNEFSAGVRGLLHDPETGITAQSGEAALHAIAGAMLALDELKERTLAQLGNTLENPYLPGRRGGDLRTRRGRKSIVSVPNSGVILAESPVQERPRATGCPTTNRHQR